MARVKFNAAIPDDAGIFAMAYAFEQSTVFIDEFSKKSVTVTSVDSGMEVVIAGKNFTQRQGELTGGTITDMIIKDVNGTILFSVEDGAPSKIPKGFAIEAVGYAFFGLMAGDDKVVGSLEADILVAINGKDKVIGALGDDMLFQVGGVPTFTGGLGSDHFLLSPSKGFKTTVTDFDAVGGGIEQDYIFLGDDATYNAFERGNDLLVKIDGGGTVVLKGVEFPDFDIGDFRDPPPGFVG